jgi:aspartyl-tRNA(Asn)/glutamyl-tRNA(Gln) amidotransferase subunit A
VGERATGARSGPAPTQAAGTLAGQIRRREISAVEAVEDAFARIEASDGEIAAFCTLARPQALAEAAMVDARLRAGEDVGPLAGVPVAIKDLISTRGLRTTFGSPLYRDNVPMEDDVAVERLRQVGAIVIGKTNTSEFGYGPVGHNPLFATTRNPWDLSKTTGGSSAGSAAAIAAGMVPLALGSDGGGSVRIPAALCGVFGIKPSWGRVPVYPGCRDGAQPGASGWESLEHIGPLTRTVADAALALSALSGPTSRDRHSIPREPVDWTDLDAGQVRTARIAYSADLGFATVDPEIARIVEAAVKQLAGTLGCAVEFAAPDIGDTQDAFEGLVALDTDRAGLRLLARRHGHSFGGVLGSLLDREWSADAFTSCILERKRIANTMWRFMERFDFLLTPSVAVAAFEAGRDGPGRIAGRDVPPSAWTPFSAVANLTGQPAASVPCGFTKDGHPVGLQIIGRHLDDIGVLRLSAAFEAISPWAQLWPPMVAVRQAA